jgi:type II secretory pathway component PulF
MPESSNKKLSGDETRELAERLVEVAGSGLPLADGLWAVSCEIPRRRVRRRLQQLAEFVRRGGTLEQALEAGQLPLPGHVAGLLRAGARAGHLPQVLTELADHYRSSRDVWRQLWLALSYPVTLLGLLTVIVAIMISLVVPEMAVASGPVE